MRDVIERLKALIGQADDSGLGIAEVDKNTIRLWADAFGDRNPLYTDEQYAQQSKYGGIIAPLIMAVTYCWMHRRPITDPSAVGGASPVSRRIMEVGEFNSSIVQKYEWDFLAPLRLGDRVSCAEKVVDISEQKETRLGTGHFVTREIEYKNQRGEIAMKARTTVFFYWTESGQVSGGPI